MLLTILINTAKKKQLVNLEIQMDAWWIEYDT